MTWSTRIDLLKQEISDMFLSYNRAIQPKTTDSKAELMSDTLASLQDNKIREFFMYVRENESTMPSDGRLKAILRSTSPRFTKSGPDNLQIEHKATFTAAQRADLASYASKYPAFAELINEAVEDDRAYPSDEWRSQFFKLLGTKGSLISTIN